MLGESEQWHQEHWNLLWEWWNKTTQDIVSDPQFQAFFKASPERDRAQFNLELAKKDLARDTNWILRELSSTLWIPMPTSVDNRRWDVSLWFWAKLWNSTNVWINGSWDIRGININTTLPSWTRLGADYWLHEDRETFRISAQWENWSMRGDIADNGTNTGVVSFNNGTTSADMTVAWWKNLKMNASSVTAGGTKFNIDYTKQGDEQQGSLTIAKPLNWWAQANFWLWMNESSRTVTAWVKGSIPGIKGGTFFSEASVNTGWSGNSVSLGMKMPI